MPAQHLSKKELAVVGDSFGLTFSDGGAPNGLVHLYVEDDETWNYTCTFNHFWLKDLEKVVTQAINKNPYGGIL